MNQPYSRISEDVLFALLAVSIGWIAASAAVHYPAAGAPVAPVVSATAGSSHS